MNFKPLAGAALLALAATTTTAHAQLAGSSVTMFGVVDVDVTYGKGSLTTLRSLGNSGLSGSRLGFRGVEDLGGGLRASFVLAMRRHVPWFVECERAMAYQNARSNVISPGAVRK